MKATKGFLSILSTTTSVMMISGCASTGWPLATVAQRTLPIPNPPPARCLAISGGGIRSGAVSLGVLQGLHDSKQLSQFEFVSTVSGGGYPVYGIINQMTANHRTVDELLKENSPYVADVESHSDFLDQISDIYGAGMSALIKLLLPTTLEGGMYDAYKAKIHRTFSGGSSFISTTHGYTASVPLPATFAVHSQGFPTPIFVTSANDGGQSPHSDHPYSLGDIFELSPMSIGGPNFHYYGTESHFGDWISTIDAVAMSAAAIDTPQGKTQLPAIAKVLDLGLGRHFYAPDQNGGTTSFTLEDGGFIENLGIVPLLRHGCTEILAFDNSDDTLPFDAWTNFKSRINEHQEPGWKISEPLTSRTVHMEAPEFAEHTELEESEIDVWKWRLPEHLWDAELEFGSQHVHVTVVKLGIDKMHLDQYPPVVREFARTNWPKGGQPTCVGKEIHRRCAFPLESTARQTFTKDEFEAYRQMGYWLANLTVSKADAENPAEVGPTK